IFVYDVADLGTPIASWDASSPSVSYSSGTVTINTGASISLIDGHQYRVVVSPRTFVNADDNGNTSIDGTTWQFTADAVPPTVQSIVRKTPSNPITNANTVTFTVNFSEPVKGIDASDFTIAGTGVT